MVLWERVFQQVLIFSKQFFSSKSNALLKSWFNFWCYVDIQFKLWQEVIILFESLRRCLNWFKIWFSFKVFDSKFVFSPKTTLSEIIFLRKWEKVKFDFLTMYIDKEDIFFGSKLSEKVWSFETSFTRKSVALFKFPFKTWYVVNRMFQNLRRRKISDWKKEELCKID